MRKIFLKSKIHRARVTRADKEYEGSLSLDADLMESADLLPYERVEVYNVSNGERFATYLIKGEPSSHAVGVYGAAAHKVNLGDRLIIASYVWLDEAEIEFFMPRIVILDESNRVKEVK